MVYHRAIVSLGNTPMVMERDSLNLLAIGSLWRWSHGLKMTLYLLAYADVLGLLFVKQAYLE